MSKKLNIGVLLNGGKEWMGGVYYTRNLVSALKWLPFSERPRVTLFVTEGTPPEFYADVEDELTTVEFIHLRLSSRRLVRALSSRLWGSADFQALKRAILRSGVQVLLPLHSVPERELPVKWVGWIPDFQHIHLPEMFQPEERLTRDRMYAGLAAEADMMIFSSKAALNDFEHLFPESKTQKEVLSFRAVLGADSFAVDAACVGKKYELPSKFLLLPNQFWKHKNHLTVFKAMKILRERGLDIRLFCTGHFDDYRNPSYGRMLQDYLRDNEIESRVTILGLLPREDQIQLMRLATAIVQPSLFEGWSTVIEEGRSLGKKMYISDIPANVEQDPAGAVYFSAEKAGELADKLAAEWADLPSCPDAKAEDMALVENETRYRLFGERIIEIAAAL